MTSNLPVVKIIQKALHQKFPVMWLFKMKKRRAFLADIGSFEVRRKNTFCRKSNYSNFVSRVIQLFRIETFQTVLTFFPPISCSVTKFSTVSETKHRSIHLSKITNKKYTHIVLDVGAAEKHYEAIWINPDEFKDIIIYLGNILATWFHVFYR